MSRKHFRALATRIAMIECLRSRRLAAEAVADVCRSHNPNFNRFRFMAACNLA